MSAATYPTYNLFSRDAVSDGSIAGASMSIIGLGEDANITFNNAGGAEVVMQQQRSISPGLWANIGAITTGQAYSFRMRLVAGFRYRFMVLSAGGSAADVNCRSVLNENYHASLGSLYSEGFPADASSTDGNGGNLADEKLSSSFTPIEDDVTMVELGGRYKVFLPDAPDASTFYGPAVAPSTELVASRRVTLPAPGDKGESFQIIVDENPTNMPVFLDGNVSNVASGAYQWADNQLVTFVSDGTTWDVHYTTDGDDLSGTSTTPDDDFVLDLTYDLVTDDTTFTKEDIEKFGGRVLHRFDLTAKSIVVSYADDIPEGTQIDHVVSVVANGHTLTTSIGDGTNYPMHDVIDDVDTSDPVLVVDSVGEYSIEKQTDKGRVIRDDGNNGAFSIELTATETGDVMSSIHTNELTNSGGSNVLLGGQGAEFGNHSIAQGHFTDYRNGINGGRLNAIMGGGDNYIGADDEAEYGTANLISGGAHHRIGDSDFPVWHSTIVGGSAHAILGSLERVDYSIIAGGSESTIDNADYAAILGGQQNKVLNRAVASAIVGGVLNTLGGGGDSSTGVAIVGGQDNIIGADDDSDYSGILGGLLHIIETKFSVILGGSTSEIYSGNSGVLAGLRNKILTSAITTAIISGRDNTIGGASLVCDNSVIVGGRTNTIGDVAQADYAGIFAGFQNKVNARYAVTLGGRLLSATKDFYAYAHNINLKSCPRYADDTAAGVAGLTTGDLWQTTAVNNLSLPVGVLMIKQ